MLQFQNLECGLTSGGNYKKHAISVILKNVKDCTCIFFYNSKRFVAYLKKSQWNFFHGWEKSHYVERRDHFPPEI